ncbi:hypothetical protein ACHAWF_010763 [Thalassiosira exigua]
MSFLSSARRVALRARGCRRALPASGGASSSSTGGLLPRSLASAPPRLAFPRGRRAPSSSSPFSTAAAFDVNPDDDEEAPVPFASLGLHPSSLHAIHNKFKLEHTTEIQSKTFEAASSGRDVLGRARTGTGKTLAFLLPAIESALRAGRTPGDGVAVVVLSPTRELAMQIHDQAGVLASSHANGPDTDAMYGGYAKGSDLRALEDRLPFVLVATPGRLKDHMNNSYVRGRRFEEVVGEASVWVLDEADRCLDMGFRPDIEWRVQASQERQTLLFSATLPKDLRSIMAAHMRPNYLTVDCVQDFDPASHTNANVDQTFVTLPDASRGRWIAGLVDILEDIMRVQNPKDHKVICFFPTTTMCQLFSHIFSEKFGIPVLELHSKKSQSARTGISNKFRKSRRGVLFTTDVSARGVDYPDVTHVLQHGGAECRETYIHRLGRTGRAGKRGRGIIVLGHPSEEKQFINRELQGLDLRRDERYQTIVDGDHKEDDGPIEAKMEMVRRGIGQGSDPSLRKIASTTYRSLMGYMVSNMEARGHRHKADVVEHVNSLAAQMGFATEDMPKFSPRLVQAIGLQGIRGITIGRDYNADNGNGDGRGGGYGRGGDGRGGYSRGGDGRGGYSRGGGGRGGYGRGGGGRGGGSGRRREYDDNSGGRGNGRDRGERQQRWESDPY